MCEGVLHGTQPGCVCLAQSSVIDTRYSIHDPTRSVEERAHTHARLTALQHVQQLMSNCSSLWLTCCRNAFHSLAAKCEPIFQPTCGLVSVVRS